jgi:hypothetical protein
MYIRPVEGNDMGKNIIYTRNGKKIVPFIGKVMLIIYSVAWAIIGLLGIYGFIRGMVIGDLMGFVLLIFPVLAIGMVWGCVHELKGDL